MNILNLMSKGAAPGLALDLANVAKKQGLNVRLFIKSDNELLERVRSELESGEVVIIYLKKSSIYALFNAIFGGRLVFRKIRKFLISAEPIVIPMPSIFEIFIPKFISRSYKVFTVLHDPFRHKGDLLPRNSMIKYSYRKSKNLIYFSNYTRNYLRFKYGNRQLPELVMNHPIPSLALRSVLSDKAPSKYLLLIGRNKKYQNFKAIVDFWCEFSAKVPNLNLVIAGQDTAKFASSQHRIIVKSEWMSEIEFGNLVSQASAVLLPYLEASQSGPASLAIGLRRPVIYSRVGGLPEQLFGYKLGFPFSTTSELLHQIEKIPALSDESHRVDENWVESWSDLVTFVKDK